MTVILAPLPSLPMSNWFYFLRAGPIGGVRLLRRVEEFCQKRDAQATWGEANPNALPLDRERAVLVLESRMFCHIPDDFEF